MPEAPADAAHLFLDDLERVDQRGQDDHRRPVLIVVEDRDVELLLQAVLDLEAARRRDILQVDPAEHGRHGLDEQHDLVDVLGGEAEREGVDVGQLLEEEGLAFHDRQGRPGPDVAEAEHRGPIGDDGHTVLLDRERIGLLGVRVDRHAHARDPGGVGHRQVVAGLEGHLRFDLNLPAQVHQEGAVRHVDDPYPPDAAHLVDDLLAELLVARLERGRWRRCLRRPCRWPT